MLSAIRNGTRDRRTNRPTRTAARPTVEQLETRMVPTVTYGGGPLLPHVEVDAVFYGKAWYTDPQLKQEAQQLQRFLGMLTNSSFMDMLGEYSTDWYSIGRGQCEGSLYVTDDLPGLLQDGDIRSMLDTLVNRGDLPAPDGNRMYMVFTPPGVQVQDGNEVSGRDFTGYHNAFSDGYYGYTAYYGVIPCVPYGQGGWLPDEFQCRTESTAHELAEAVTDPDTRTGWRDYQNGPENMDLSAGKFGTLNGFVIQAGWSLQYNAPCIPGDAHWGVPQAYTANLLGAANAFTHSTEYFAGLVAGCYQRYLGRQPDAQGLAGWVAGLQHGLRDEQLEAGFIGSPEYIQRHGGNAQGWVTGLYQDLLGRTPSAAEVNGWAGALGHGASPAQVAYGFAASAEREALRVAADYRQFLGRAPSQAEVANIVNAFVHGATNEQVIAGFIGSQEYFYNCCEGFRDCWVVAAYRAVLGRTPGAAEINAWVKALG